jgi:hypothetical protein
LPIEAKLLAGNPAVKVEIRVEAKARASKEARNPMEEVVVRLLARNRAVRVVDEGDTTAAQRTDLSSAGCDETKNRG